ncbi:hypothetical protein AB1M95_06945 [Sulfitobacter sp. LCG007]
MNVQGGQMVGSSDEGCAKLADFLSEISAISHLSPIVQIRTTMEAASRYLECAAFDLAADHTPEQIAEIMRAAAQMERSARSLASAQPRSDN